MALGLLESLQENSQQQGASEIQPGHLQSRNEADAKLISTAEAREEELTKERRKKRVRELVMDPSPDRTKDFIETFYIDEKGDRRLEGATEILRELVQYYKEQDDTASQGFMTEKEIKENAIELANNLFPERDPIVEISQTNQEEKHPFLSNKRNLPWGS